MNMIKLVFSVTVLYSTSVFSCGSMGGAGGTSQPTIKICNKSSKPFIVGAPKEVPFEPKEGNAFINTNTCGGDNQKPGATCYIQYDYEFSNASDLKDSWTYFTPFIVTIDKTCIVNFQIKFAFRDVKSKSGMWYGFKIDDMPEDACGFAFSYVKDKGYGLYITVQDKK
jgi:hypothetical protein